MSRKRILSMLSNSKPIDYFCTKFYKNCVILAFDYNLLFLLLILIIGHLDKITIIQKNVQTRRPDKLGFGAGIPPGTHGPTQK